ncbi:AraC family transcriptional regulator [Lacticaseibacillus camelliae]|nr:AraC family transcriptional regulator [Lacticaseibacillus camelliae]
MGYLISLNDPIIHVWSGHLVKKAGPAWKHRRNHHSADTELMLLEKGTLYLSVNGEPVTLRPGQPLLIPPDATVEGTQATTEAVSLFWIHFFAAIQPISDADSRISTANRQRVAGNTATALNQYALIPAVYQADDPQGLLLLFHQLLQAVNENPVSERQNDFFTAYLLCQVSNDFMKTLPVQKPESLASTKISEWVRTNISKTLTVRDVANQFELNASYLSRLFKREMGVSLKSYILDMKISYAKYLLASTNLLVAEVGDKAYFGDPKQFMHTFKQRVGISPSEFRASMSRTHLNTETVDPKSQLPAQFGTEAVRRLIGKILSDQQTPQQESGSTSSQ